MIANSIDADAQYTQFSLAFLKDTNWYADIDLSQGENSPWGEGKGCDFLLNTCSNEAYPEFNNNQEVMDGGCSFSGHAITYTIVHDFVETDCKIRAEY